MRNAGDRLRWWGRGRAVGYEMSGEAAVHTSPSSADGGGKECHDEFHVALSSTARPTVPVGPAPSSWEDPAQSGSSRARDYDGELFGSGGGIAVADATLAGVDDCEALGCTASRYSFPQSWEGKLFQIDLCLFFKILEHSVYCTNANRSQLVYSTVFCFSILLKQHVCITR